MADAYEIIKLKVLLHLLKNEKEVCSVVKISRMLDVNKQKISRIIMELEREGFADRSDKRHPVLTEDGVKLAEKYAERIKVSLNHLLFEGVSLENAEQDAFHWALYNTDETMNVIRNSEVKYRVKYELREYKKFSGQTLCDRLGDGMYTFHFIMYRQHVHDGNILSMANNGFEHPCHLIVKNGVGKIRLRAVKIKTVSPLSGDEISGKVESMKYFSNGEFMPADVSNDIISFPADVITFVNIGEDINQVLHGTAFLKIKTTVNTNAMPESVALFNMII